MNSEPGIGLDPWRVPNWRYLCAVEILQDGPGPAASFEGERDVRRISRLVDFLRQYRRCGGSPRLLRQLRQREPHLYSAHELYNDDLLQQTRWIVEARILAREKPAEIAGKLGCNPQLIKVFATLYFDVRSRLDHKDYIEGVVFSKARNSTKVGNALAWKIIGYHFGPKVLNAVVGGFSNPLHVDSVEDLSGTIKELIQDTLNCNAAAAAVRVLSATDSTIAGPLVRATLGKRLPEGDASPNSFLRNIEAMLENLPFEVATDPHRAKDPVLGEYEGLAAELNTKEMLLLKTGLPVEGLEEVKNLKFPDETPSVHIPTEA
jgi:hypothetical protein